MSTNDESTSPRQVALTEGLGLLVPLPPYVYGRECGENERVLPVEQVLAYAAACVAAERERCAKLCEAEADNWRGLQDISDFKLRAFALGPNVL